MSFQQSTTIYYRVEYQPSCKNSQEFKLNGWIRAQVENTNFDFRKRIYEMKRAKEEAEYQMRSVRNFFAQGPENFFHLQLRKQEWYTEMDKMEVLRLGCEEFLPGF